MMRRLFQISLFILVVVALLLAVLVATLDLDRFRSSIAAVAGRALGRELILAGPLDLSLGRTVTLSARDITVTNPDWAEDAQFLHAESIWIEVDAASLLSGPVVVNQVRLRGIDLDLESRPDGEPNWEFETGAGEAGETADGDDPPVGSPVLVKRLLIEGAHIEYSGPLVDAPVNLVLHSVTQELNGQSNLELDLDASLNGEPVVLHMEVGEYAELEALGAVSLSLTGTAGLIEFTGEAAVEELRTLAGPRGELHLHGPSFRYLAELLNLRGDTDGPLQLTVSLADDGDKHHLEALGRLGGADAVVRGNVGDPDGSRFDIRVSGSSLAASLDTLGVAGAPDIPFDTRAVLQLDDGELAAPEINVALGENTITGSARGRVAGAAWSLEAPFSANLAAVAQLLPPDTLSGELPEPLRSLQFRGRLRAGPDTSGLEQLAIRLEVEGSIAGSDLAGEVEFIQAETPRLNAALQSEMVDLRPWVSLGGDNPGGQQQGVAGEAPVQQGEPAARLIPDTDVSGFSLPELDVDLEYHAQRLETDLEYIENLRVDGRLQAGSLTLEEVSFLGQGGGRVRASMGLEPLAPGLEAWLRVAGDNISVGLPAQDPEEVAQLPRYDLSLAYVASGATLREMAAGSHGYLRMASGPGRVDISAMRIFTDDFMLELLNTVNPFAKEDKYSNIECSTLLAVVEHGKLVGDPLLVVQSDRLQVLADANIDLGTEIVEADFNTIPMKGLGIGLSNLLHPYVNVRGTLANPSMGFDSASALVSGGATVATGGLSILAKGLFDRMSADRQACATALAAAKEEFDRLEALYGSGTAEGGDS